MSYKRQYFPFFPSQARLRIWIATLERLKLLQSHQFSNSLLHFCLLKSSIILNREYAHLYKSLIYMQCLRSLIFCSSLPLQHLCHNPKITYGNNDSIFFFRFYSSHGWKKVYPVTTYSISRFSSPVCRVSPKIAAGFHSIVIPGGDELTLTGSPLFPCFYSFSVYLFFLPTLALTFFLFSSIYLNIFLFPLFFSYFMLFS